MFWKYKYRSTARLFFSRMRAYITKEHGSEHTASAKLIGFIFFWIRVELHSAAFLHCFRTQNSATRTTSSAHQQKENSWEVPVVPEVKMKRKLDVRFGGGRSICGFSAEASSTLFSNMLTF